MRERQERLKAIKRIIRETRIDSQERLLHHLEEDGFRVTQATLSRDLKTLRVGKQVLGNEGYFYSLPSEETSRERESNFIHDLERGFISLDFSGTLLIMRTLSGHADSVAMALDNLSIDGVLGTIAGDDTVFAALADSITREQFLDCLRRRVPTIDV